MSRFALAFVLFGLAACEPSVYLLDGGPEPDGGGPMGQVVIESDPSLALTFGDESEIIARYLEAGVPVEGVSVRFAIEGRAHDSSITALSQVTGADGTVRTRVVAGTTAAVFRVRVSADRAAAAHVDVSVGNMGFGSLRVVTRYEGSREEVMRRVELYSGATCDEALPEVPDTMALANTGEARFRTLPAGLRYAVLGRVLGPTGVTLASSCADVVELVRDIETEITLELVDTPLGPEGNYELELTAYPSEPIGLVMELATLSGLAQIEGAGSDAALYLDALEEELHERGQSELADALAIERVGGIPDLSLGSRFDPDGEGPTAAFLAYMSTLGERLAGFAIRGRFALHTGASGLDGIWTPDALTTGVSGDPDTPPLPISREALELSSTIDLRWTAEEDAIELEALRVALPLGRLARVTTEAEASARGYASPGMLLAGAAGCDVFAGWVAESPTLAPICDETCAQAACVRALDGLVETAGAALVAADEARDTVDVRGRLVLADTDADLVVDRIEGVDLEARWVGPLGDPGDVIRAALEGARAE